MRHGFECANKEWKKRIFISYYWQLDWKWQAASNEASVNYMRNSHPSKALWGVAGHLLPTKIFYPSYCFHKEGKEREGEQRNNEILVASAVSRAASDKKYIWIWKAEKIIIFYSIDNWLSSFFLRLAFFLDFVAKSKQIFELRFGPRMRARANGKDTGAALTQTNDNRLVLIIARGQRDKFDELPRALSSLRLSNLNCAPRNQPLTDRSGWQRERAAERRARATATQPLLCLARLGTDAVCRMVVINAPFGMFSPPEYWKII